jgi:PAS domain S-box-containing protein
MALASIKTRDTDAALLRAVLDAVPTACMVTDGHVVILVNAQARALFRCEDGTTIEGRQVFDIVHPDGRETMRQRGDVLLHKDQVLNGLPIKLLALDGTCFTLRATATPLDHDGRRVVLFTAE